MSLSSSVTCLIAVSLLVAATTQIAFSDQHTRQAIISDCHDAANAFSLLSQAQEDAVVADRGAPGRFRQAARLFYRCAQHETDGYLHDSLMLYYVESLLNAGKSGRDGAALSLALNAARHLAQITRFDDVRNDADGILVNNEGHTAATVSDTTPRATPTPPSHSDAYCERLAPLMVELTDNVRAAIAQDLNAGQNDTQVLAFTTARYGSAYKYVEDDFAAMRDLVTKSNNDLVDASQIVPQLSDAEQSSVRPTLDLWSQTVGFVNTYGLLSLGFERAVNAANRQVARARMQQAFAGMMRDTSYSYTSGSAYCYSGNCSTNLYTNTEYNNSATIAQRSAANALAAAQEGRLSYTDATTTLAQGLSTLQQVDGAIQTAQRSWSTVCSTR